jgi:hypothetical protein
MGLRVGAAGAVMVVVVVVIGNVITTGAGWNDHGEADWGKAYIAISEGWSNVIKRGGNRRRMGRQGDE